MPFLFLLLALAAGAFIGWISVLGGIWFIMPVFLICGAIVSIALPKEFRWRLAAFSVGLLAVFFLQAKTFISQVEAEQKIQMRMQKERREKQRLKDLQDQRQQAERLQQR